MRSKSTNPDKNWLQSRSTRLTPLVDLVCIAGAGAGASRFNVWHDLLPGYCGLHLVQLPGRENRIDESPIDSLTAIVEKIAAAASGLGKRRPLILFGHSMGAVLAFELAAHMQQQGRSPAALIMSATTPPKGDPDRDALDDAELRRLLLAFDPNNRKMLENADLRASLAPALRADFQVLRRHRIEPDRVLSGIPTRLWSGESDPVVSNEDVALWQKHLAGDVAQNSFEGGHQFPFEESQHAVTSELSRLSAKIAKMRTNAR